MGTAIPIASFFFMSNAKADSPYLQDFPALWLCESIAVSRNLTSEFWVLISPSHSPRPWIGSVILCHNAGQAQEIMAAGLPHDPEGKPCNCRRAALLSKLLGRLVMGAFPSHHVLSYQWVNQDVTHQKARSMQTNHFPFSFVYLNHTE